MEDNKDLKEIDEKAGEDAGTKTEDTQVKNENMDEKLAEALRLEREKWEKEQVEKERLAKLSEEEKQKELQKQKEEAIRQKEKELAEKELQINLRDALTAEGLDLSLKDMFMLDKYVDLETKNDVLKEDIVNFKKLFEAEVEKRIEAFKTEYLRGETPAGLGEQTKEVKTSNPLQSILNKLK